MRGTESEETIQRRLSHAIEDVKTAEKINFDLVIVNSDLKEAVAVFTDFVKDVSDVLNWNLLCWPNIFLILFRMYRESKSNKKGPFILR